LSNALKTLTAREDAVLVFIFSEGFRQVKIVLPETSGGHFD